MSRMDVRTRIFQLISSLDVVDNISGLQLLRETAADPLCADKEIMSLEVADAIGAFLIRQCDQSVKKSVLTEDAAEEALNDITMSIAQRLDQGSIATFSGSLPFIRGM